MISIANLPVSPSSTNNLFCRFDPRPSSSTDAATLLQPQYYCSSKASPHEAGPHCFKLPNTYLRGPTPRSVSVSPSSHTDLSLSLSLQVSRTETLGIKGERGQEGRRQSQAVDGAQNGRPPIEQYHSKYPGWPPPFHAGTVKCTRKRGHRV